MCSSIRSFFPLPHSSLYPVSLTVLRSRSFLFLSQLRCPVFKCKHVEQCSPSFTCLLSFVWFLVRRACESFCLTSSSERGGVPLPCPNSRDRSLGLRKNRLRSQRLKTTKNKNKNKSKIPTSVVLQGTQMKERMTSPFSCYGFPRFAQGT